jgi:hypothetical protein
MKTSRLSIILGYDERVETEPGVFDTQITEKKVKAEQEAIFQSRRDDALNEGNVITARFRIRSNLIKNTLRYVIWNGKKYKLRSAVDDVTSHFTVIELGELL